jgi:hypothetical protein
MLRDMSNTYRWTKTDDLEENLSRKKQELHRLLNKEPSYFHAKDVKRLTHYMRQIEAELQSRRDQLNLI